MTATYVLVTPAHNEAEFIKLTIESVINQTVRPIAWAIVSDRSTDDTDKIIQEYAAAHPFIKYIRKEHGAGRDTAAKVAAINMGLERLKEYSYDFIGNLDADVSFGPDYFQKLLNLFTTDSSFGIIGGRIYHNVKNQLVENKSSEDSVAGAVQFFRKECFEQIGGYMSLKGGFEDAAAELSARYHGWKTKSFKELVVTHHREIGTVKQSVWMARFNNGVNEFIFGYSFCYHVMRLCYYASKKPVLLGSMLGLFGFLYAMMSGRKKIIPGHLVEFQQKEQKARVIGRLRESILGQEEKISC